MLQICLGGCPRTHIFVILVNSGAIISMGYECIFHKKAILGQPPRIARVDTPGLLHHVMIRGIERRKHIH